MKSSKLRFSASKEKFLFNNRLSFQDQLNDTMFASPHIRYRLVKNGPIKIISNVYEIPNTQMKY